tara:strand:- start:648 stop:1283 length:636 start_codon:yes stop_codon:yes gene_type:complete
VANKLSELQKKEIKELFAKGNSITELANLFQFSTQTITRQLKLMFNRDQFNNLKKISAKNKNLKLSDKKFVGEENVETNIDLNVNESSQEQTFFEVIPLLNEANLEQQKDLTSVPIADVNFPKIVYMIVDKKIELEIKFLKDYPEWDFLSNDDLNRKTIEIFFDLKIAKRLCNKEQKVIKVPNTDVFKMVAPILLSRGISRIVSNDKLIAL